MVDAERPDIGGAGPGPARRRSAKLGALLWGPLVCLTVVATANHYVFDIAAGLAVSVAGYLVGPRVARLVANRSRPARRGRRPELALQGA